MELERFPTPLPEGEAEGVESGRTHLDCPAKQPRLHPSTPRWRTTSARPMPSASASARSRASARTTPKALMAARGKGYDSVRDLWLRSGLSRAAIERLADADAFRSLGLDRRDALWAARGLGGGKADDRLPLFDVAELVPTSAASPTSHCRRCRSASTWSTTTAILSLSLKAHPVSFIRASARRAPASSPARRSRDTPNGTARHRRRPGPRPPAAGHGERRHLHDARGRDRHRQRHRLAQGLRAFPAGRARRPAGRGHRQECRAKAASSTSSPTGWRI